MPEEVKEIYGQTVSSAYHEDKVVMEAIQRLIAQDPRGANYTEVSFSGDAGGMLARSALARILAAERGNQKSEKPRSAA